LLDLAFMGKVLPLYYEGALLTLRVGAIGILLALAVGMITAVARYWRIPILNTAAVIYTEFSRNTPLLVQLFFLYFGLPKVGIRISGEWCAIIGLAFLGGSYMAEALRAGLESVSTVQTESARVLGLTPFQTMMLVVLPQAFAVSVPPLVANIIFLIKEISVVSHCTSGSDVRHEGSYRQFLQNRRITHSSRFGLCSTAAPDFTLRLLA